MYAKYILNYSQTQLCVSREPFPPFSTCDGFFQCCCCFFAAATFYSTEILLLIFFFIARFIHLHVCLICGLFCRNFFYPPLNLFSLLKSLSPDVPVLRVFSLFLYLASCVYVACPVYFQYGVFSIILLNRG